jgi:hypothetical protein
MTSRRNEMTSVASFIVLGKLHVRTVYCPLYRIYANLNTRGFQRNQRQINLRNVFHEPGKDQLVKWFATERKTAVRFSVQKEMPSFSPRHSPGRIWGPGYAFFYPTCTRLTCRGVKLPNCKVDYFFRCSAQNMNVKKLHTPIVSSWHGTN